MPSKVVEYKCDICGKTWQTIKLANNCENGHKDEAWAKDLNLLKLKRCSSIEYSGVTHNSFVVSVRRKRKGYFTVYIHGPNYSFNLHRVDTIKRANQLIGWIEECPHA